MATTFPSPDHEVRRVALITGASRGIGAAVARRLALDGFRVVVSYAGSVADADSVVQHIKAAGGEAIAAQGDVADAQAVRQLFDSAERDFGPVDVLVNNAGVMPPHLPHLADTDDATFERLVAINLRGTFHALREAARRMPPGGRIVNFSSSLVGTALPGYAVYAATKAAVEALTSVMAKELRGRNITVNAVAPGPTATALFLDGKSPELVARLAQGNPMERLGTPEDIANAVAFLAGPDGAWINGQTLRANGGMV